MSNVWFTSDLHIGHKTVAELRATPAVTATLPGRPDLVTRWHDRILANGWDATVAPSDTVWVLGDLSAGGTEATAYALNWIADRPGIKHLVAGNHDPVHPMRRDAHQWQSRQSAYQVFASVQPFARRKIAGRQVMLSHFPYVGDHTAEDRFNQYRLRDRGEILLHGHTHSREKTSRGRTRGQGIPGVVPWPGPLQIHVGVDAWDLRPASLDEIGELIAREDVS